MTNTVEGEGVVARDTPKLKIEDESGEPKEETKEQAEESEAQENTTVDYETFQQFMNKILEEDRGFDLAKENTKL